MRGEEFVDVARAIAPRTVNGMKDVIPTWIVKYGQEIDAKLCEKNGGGRDDTALLRQCLEALENSSPDQYPEDAGVFYDTIAALQERLK
jgi:hypothetical protein